MLSDSTRAAEGLSSRHSIHDYKNELEDQDIVEEFNRTISDFGDYLKYGPAKNSTRDARQVAAPATTTTLANGTAASQSTLPFSASVPTKEDQRVEDRLDLLLRSQQTHHPYCHHHFHDGEEKEEVAQEQLQSQPLLSIEDDEYESLPRSQLPSRSISFVGSLRQRLDEAEPTPQVTTPSVALLPTAPSATVNRHIGPQQASALKESAQQVSVWRNNNMMERPELQRKIRELWQDALSWKDFSHQYPRHYQDLKRELQYPAMLHDAFERYNVRFTMLFDNPAIIYPRYRKTRADNGHRTVYPTGLKIITYNYSSPNPQTKLEKSTMPDEKEIPLIDYYPGIFGWHVLTPSDRKIYIASNERDAMAIWWATDQLSIALPKGDIMDRQTELLLEQFTDVTLWFTPAQRDAMKNIAYSLAAPRIAYIMAAERPFEVLRKNLNKRSISAVLQNGSRVAVRDVPPKGLFSQVEEKKGDLLESLSSHGSKLKGVAQWQRFAILNTILGGFREGEITVLTGPTGHGKTTFLCEYALDLLQQDVRTLFCSFEMTDTQILYWMAVQFHRGNLSKIDIDKQVDQFTRSNKGLIMMNTGAFQNESPGIIADSIRQEVMAVGVQHVVIDNLQFLISTSNLAANGVRVNSSLDKWALQDLFLHQMRRLADETRVHITMVVNPRKEPDDLSVQSFSGSAKVAQEADNVFVIQKRRRGEHIDGRPLFTKFLYVMKNRFTGVRVEYDRLEMKFDRNSFCHRLEDRDNDK